MAGKYDQSFLQRTVKNSLSGTAAGIAICLIGHPFDTLKVRLQTQPVHNPVYTGLVDCFTKTLKWEGIGGLYKGVGSPLAGQMILRATLFTSYYQISSLLAGEGRTRLSTAEYFLCGAYTGAVSSLAEGPIDLFKTKMQIQIIRAKSGEAVQYRNVFHAGWDIIKGHGLRGTYQGLTATWLRNIPSFGLGFGSYEIGRDYFTPEGGTVNDISAYGLFVSGAMAGLAYWIFTYPTDVVKSTLMSDDSNPAKRKFRGIVHCTQYLYREEGGWRRFYRGFSPCIMRSVPANAVMIFVLETCRRLFP